MTPVPLERYVRFEDADVVAVVLLPPAPPLGVAGALAALALICYAVCTVSLRCEGKGASDAVCARV